MKTLISPWLLIFAFTFCGCVKLPTVPPVQNSPGWFSCDKQLASTGSQPANTATAKAKQPNQPVASAVANIVRFDIVAGMLCLVAAGVLCYFGDVIPAVKVGIAGIALPVFAWWFDYHYGLVIALALIASAVGFLWAWYKDDPTQFAAVEAKAQSMVGESVAKIEAAATALQKKI